MGKTITVTLPTIDEVTFHITAEQDDIPVRGHFATGDDATDKKIEDTILRRLNLGQVWAWASVCVTARWKGGFEGTDYLGACSYKNEADFKKDGYYEDMRQVAYDDLISQILELAD